MRFDRSSISHRLKIISGQVNGLAKMIEDDKYCVDILNQSLAVQKAIKEVDKIILENHLDTCVVDQIKSGKQKKTKEELVKIFSLVGKS